MDDTHLIDKHGNVVPHGSLITWNVWDNDDLKTWNFIGTVFDATQLTGFWYGKQQFVVYLGGGIDFGSAIGSKMDFKDVIEEAYANDPDEAGITVLGLASDVPNILKKEFGI